MTQFSNAPTKVQLIAVCIGLAVVGLFALFDGLSKTASNPAPVTTTAPSPASDLKPGLYAINPNFIAAATENDLDRAIQIVSQGDKATFDKLLQQGTIIVMQPNLKVYLEGCTDSTCSVVKIRPEGKTVDLYTLVEAIKN
jgi:hypothetical protein